MVQNDFKMDKNIAVVPVKWLGFQQIKYKYFLLSVEGVVWVSLEICGEF